MEAGMLLRSQHEHLRDLEGERAGHGVKTLGIWAAEFRGVAGKDGLPLPAIGKCAKRFLTQITSMPAA